MNGIPSQRVQLGITKDETVFASPSAPIVGGEERARELMIAELRNAGVRAPLDPMIQPFLQAGVRAMLTFAAEASGIGVQAMALLNAYDEAKDEGGHYLWQAVDRAAEDLRAALAASISSREAE